MFFCVFSGLGLTPEPLTSESRGGRYVAPFGLPKKGSSRNRAPRPGFLGVRNLKNPGRGATSREAPSLEAPSLPPPKIGFPLGSQLFWAVLGCCGLFCCTKFLRYIGSLNPYFSMSIREVVIVY